MEDLVLACAGLVIIDENSGIVRLVYYMTQQYFEKTRGRWFPDAQSCLASTCTTYLLFNEFTYSGPCYTQGKYDKRQPEYPLYQYASLCWGEHARHASEINHTLMSFLKSGSNVDASIQCVVVEEGETFEYDRLEEEETFDYERPDNPSNSDVCGYELLDDWGWSSALYGTGLHLVSYFGLSVYVDAILDSSDRALDPTDIRGRTPLSWAAERGHEAVVTLLLTKGADIESIDDQRQTPLSRAAAAGRDGIVQLLLDVGADLESKDYSECTGR